MRTLKQIFWGKQTNKKQKTKQNKKLNKTKQNKKQQQQQNQTNKQMHLMFTRPSTSEVVDQNNILSVWINNLRSA